MESVDKKPRYLTPAEVAQMLMVSPVTVRQWANKGWLKAEVTAGGHRRFQFQDLMAFARERGLTLHFQTTDTTRVLVVDDDKDFTGFLIELLTKRSSALQVDAAYDGFDAGSKVRSFRPHIVLLDLMMPGLNGFSVCERIKRDPETRGIRIIAMTGYWSEDNKQRIEKAGAEACLGKPFETEDLFRALGISTDEREERL